MAMTIRECECGNLTVNADEICEECRDDIPQIPPTRRIGIDKARAFRAGAYDGENEYVGAN